MEGSNSNSPHTAEYDGPHQYGSSPEKTIDLSASDTIAMFQQMMHKMDDMYAIMHKQADEITELKQKQELPPDAEPAAAKAQKLAPSAGAVDEEKEAAEEADGNLPPSSKRMKPITLGSFSGAKYDGTLATYPDWTSDIENKLQTHQALGVLDDNQYQGRYLNNARITAGPALDDLISTGEDLQSVVGAFLVQSLSGSILTSVRRLQAERKSNPVGNRKTLTAFEIYTFVEKEANPQLSRKSRTQAQKRFQKEKLAKGADRVQLDKYVEDQEKLWCYLNRTAGPTGEDRISEHSFVSQLLCGMEEHHELAWRALENDSEDETGAFTYERFKEGINKQFQKSYSKGDRVMHLEESGNCPHCKKRHRGQCDWDPERTCGGCGKKGHSKWVCDKANRQSRQGRGAPSDKAKEAKKANRKEKRLKDRAYIQLGKEREQQLITPVQQPVAPVQPVLALRNLPSPPAAEPPAITAITAPAANTTVVQQVTLPSGVVVPLQDRMHMVMAGHTLSLPNDLSQLGLPTDVVAITLNDGTAAYGSKPGVNEGLIAATVNQADALVHEHSGPVDLSRSYAVTLGDLEDMLEEHIDFQAIPRCPDNKILVLADSPPENTESWRMHAFWIDTCASVHCVRDPALLHSCRAVTAADAVVGLKGSETPDAIGSLALRIGRRTITWPETKAFIKGTFDCDILSGGLLDEDGLHLRSRHG